MFLTNVFLEKYNKKDRSSCLFKRYGGPNLLHLSLFIGTNHARHFIGSRYISLQLEARAFKVTLEKKT